MKRICLLIPILLACTGTVDAGEGMGEENPPLEGIRLQMVVEGLERPVDLTSPAGDDRLFIVEQPGRIRIARGGSLLPEPFLDIVSRVESGGNEQGLLGLAFHPQFATNGYFYINFTARGGGHTRVERFRVSDADPDLADPASATPVLSFEQPYRNHNGGQVLFGPDGMLYIPTGDGGSRGDPQNRALDPASLLGKMLRIDVDGGQPYAIPADNPYAGRTDGRPEIWAIGLRNPWRVAFDDGHLYIADVGQNAYEEISVVPADEPGLNFGWNELEGTHCYPSGSACEREGTMLPVIEYPRSQGISITGGYVYRGDSVPALRGRYLYADFGQDWIRGFRLEAGAAVGDARLQVEGVRQISSFGQDGRGEMYVVALSGEVYRLAPAE